MIVTIQAVEERLWHVEQIKQALNGHEIVVIVDYEKRGPLWSWKQLLEVPFTGYRLHLQDDVILAPGFADYIGTVKQEAEARNMHFLSLFAPNQKAVTESKERFVRINSIWIQCCLLSEKLIQMQREHVYDFNVDKRPLNRNGDDSFLQNMIRKHKIPAWCHVPGIAQHRIDNEMRSTIGHSNSSIRQSKRFDPDFIIKK